ncbi:hypothetical protein SUDANB95_04748 [Actinosynnema sp. ALI-1.44]
MFFRVLGPLEWWDRGETVQLGGIKQRSALGFLLLHPNQVVATSRLVDALWTGEDVPASARKVLQNAVWGLRGILAGTADASRSIDLQTRAPGYRLSADPDQIDLFRFRRLVAEGQAELAAGAPERAVRLLRDALALWRGPVLADLVESGVTWPELSLIQGSRYTAMEDLFEAELSCGNHYAVLGDLEALLDAEPFRERVCAQLMLALYRCGRQADALNVYSRLRTTMVDELGLEPGRELQELQQLILAQSPTLALPGRIAVVPPRAAPAAEVAPSRPQAVRVERATAVIFRAEAVGGFGGVSSVDDMLAGLGSTIRAETAQLSGEVVASIGDFTVALFRGQGHAKRAVLAALAVRENAKRPDIGDHPPVRTAVASGETRPGEDPTGLPSVNGTLMLKCQSLLRFAAPGDILVCDDTRAATSAVASYTRVGDPDDGWRVRSRRAPIAASPATGHEPELDVLESLLDWVIRRARPHLVSVLGGPGSGKSEFLSAFQARISRDGADGPLAVRMPPFAGAWGLRACILAACCGIEPGDSPSVTREKLELTVRQWCGDKGRVGATVESLSLFLEPGDDGYRLEGRQEAAREWSSLVTRIAMDRPVVVFIDDLHTTDDALLDFIEGLADSVGAVPVMVIAAARPELLDRRADWGGGKLHGTMMTLDRKRREEDRLSRAVS